MNHVHHHHHHANHHHEAHGSHGGHAARPSLNSVALRATIHCLSGCAVGEILGMVVGTALGFSTVGTIALAVSLAFVFGYAFTLFPLLRSGMSLATAAKVALVADTASIAFMELVDNGLMLAIPGSHGRRARVWLVLGRARLLPARCRSRRVSAQSLAHLKGQRPRARARWARTLMGCRLRAGGAGGA